MATMKELAALLGVKLGEEFRISGSQRLYKFDDNGLMYKSKDEWEPYETASTLCGLFTGKRKMVKLPWKPKEGDYYCFFDFADRERIVKVVWNGSLADLALYAIGNCFYSRAEAEAHRDKVIASLKSTYETGISTDTGREEQESEKPSVEEAIKTLKEYCTERSCEHCNFCVDKENGEGCRLKDTPAIWPYKKRGNRPAWFNHHFHEDN